MRPSTRYAVAVLVGVVAAVVAFVAARPVVDATQTALVAALNALVWIGAVAVYLGVYDRFDGAPAGGDGVDQHDQLKWGGLGGVVGSLGIAGPTVLLVDVAPVRYAGALALFAFGLVTFSLSIGMATVTTRFEGVDPGSGSGPNAADGGAEGQTPADD